MVIDQTFSEPLVIVMSESESSDSEDSENLPLIDQDKWQDANRSDLPSDYWNIQKLLKFIKVLLSII